MVPLPAQISDYCYDFPAFIGDGRIYAKVSIATPTQAGI